MIQWIGDDDEEGEPSVAEAPAFAETVETPPVGPGEVRATGVAHPFAPDSSAGPVLEREISADGNGRRGG